MFLVRLHTTCHTSWNQKLLAAYSVCRMMGVLYSWLNDLWGTLFWCRLPWVVPPNNPWLLDQESSFLTSPLAHPYLQPAHEQAGKSGGHSRSHGNSKQLEEKDTIKNEYITCKDQHQKMQEEGCWDTLIWSLVHGFLKGIQTFLPGYICVHSWDV